MARPRSFGSTTEASPGWLIPSFWSFRKRGALIDHPEILACAMIDPKPGMLRWAVQSGLAAWIAEKGESFHEKAIRSEDTDTAAWLVFCGADPNAAESGRLSPLGLAIERNHIDSIKALMLGPLDLSQPVLGPGSPRPLEYAKSLDASCALFLSANGAR